MAAELYLTGLLCVCYERLGVTRYNDGCVPAWRTERRSSCTWLRPDQPADTAEGRSWSALLSAGPLVKLGRHRSAHTEDGDIRQQKSLQVHVRINPSWCCKKTPKWPGASRRISLPLRVCQLYATRAVRPHESAGTHPHLPYGKNERSWWHTLMLRLCMCWRAATSSLPSDVKAGLSDHPSERPISPNRTVGRRTS